jgi:3'-phosphoadenosine 5'-phosphosulfate synthase
MDYERVHVSDDSRDEYRYRQQTLKRWRLSMALAFCAGMMVTMFVQPLLQAPPPRPVCPSCPSCPAQLPVSDRALEAAAEKAVGKCPSCPKCPRCPKSDCAQPAPCPDCRLECPAAKSAACPDAASVAASQRVAMLTRPLKNILECKPGEVCRADSERRSKVLGQKGVTLWMTGLSGSGKTTIAEALEKELLFALGKNVYRIDGDNLRTGLTRDLGFSPADRAESVRRASEVAALFADAGLVTMVTLISPYRKDRDEAVTRPESPPPSAAAAAACEHASLASQARALHAKRGIPFYEVFMDVPLSVVQARDPKGLYAKVAKGLIKNFTGVDAPCVTHDRTACAAPRAQRCMHAGCVVAGTRRRCSPR